MVGGVSSDDGPWGGVVAAVFECDRESIIVDLVFIGPLVSFSLLSVSGGCTVDSTGYLYEFLPLTAQQASRTGHPLQSVVTWGTKMP